MLRYLALFLLSLVSGYGIAQTSTFEVKDLVNTQYTLGGDDDHVLAVTFQRDAAGAPVVVSWQTNDPKDVLRSHSYTTAGSQASHRVQIDLTTKPAAADAGVLWLSTKAFEEITKGKTMLELNKDEKGTGFVNAGKEPYSVYRNGKELTFNTIHLKSVGTEKGKEQELWVVDNAQNPIIVKANGVYSYDMTDVMVDTPTESK